MALLSLVSWYDDDVESQLGELQSFGVLSMKPDL
jgi:hypothetical protein